MGLRTLEYVRLDELVPDARNPKAHALDDLEASLARWGYTEPIMIDERTGHLVSGHGRVEVAVALMAAGAEVPDGIDVAEDGGWLVPVVRGWASADDVEAGAYLVAANELTTKGGWRADPLAELLTEVAASQRGLEGTGYTGERLEALLAQLAEPGEGDGGGERGPDPRTTTLAERFLVPPFSVLDARQGYWQDRKKAWLALGIRSELGRGEVLTYSDDGNETTQKILGATPRAVEPGGSRRGPAGELGWRPSRAHTVPGGAGHSAGGSSVWLGVAQDGTRQAGPRSLAARAAQKMGGRREADQASNLTGAPPLPEWADNGVENMAAGTSIFDPVLCELAYRWFSPPAGRVLDPFAGGSVRGVVASLLGRRYTGVDLAAAQVAANREQAAELCTTTLTGDPAPAPEWHVGDSRTTRPGTGPYDLVFSCPPYFDLEVYSDDPADLSQAGDRDAFVAGLTEVLTTAAGQLADDRFVVLVMGEARSKRGDVYGLIPGTYDAARAAGLTYYNEAVLVTMAGSLPLRAGKAFSVARKLGRTHQSVLVFVKGDARAAVAACGPVEVPVEVLAAPPTE